MNGKTHVRIALACGLYAALALESQPVPMMSIVGGAFLAARLPDVDINLPIKHRGLTHSVLLTALLAFAAVYFLPRNIALGAIVGYISHIIADMATVQGVGLLWPIPWRVKFPGAFIRTGSIFETAISLGVLVGIGLMLYQWAGSDLDFDLSAIRSLFTW
jgi:inner membrane protein